MQPQSPPNFALPARANAHSDGPQVLRADSSLAVRDQLLQVRSCLSEMGLDRAASLLEGLQEKLQNPAERLMFRAVHLSLHLQAEASRAEALLLQEAYELQQQATAFADDPLVEVLTLFPLAEIQTRMRLHHGALSSLERGLQLSQQAHTQALYDQLQALRGRVMAQAGMYEELLKNSDALLARRADMSPGTVHRILNYCATACFALADEQIAPPRHPLWLRCKALHLDALHLAQSHGLQEDVHLSRLNLAYIELLAGDSADARHHIESLLGTDADSVWRQIAGARQALGLSQTLLRWREQGSLASWQAVLALEAELAQCGEGLRFVHEYLLRAIVRFGAAAGDSASALRCSQLLLGFQRQRLQVLSGTLSRAVEDVFQLQRMRLENEQLARHGGQLEQSLAARNAELQQTLSRLRAEASIRRAAEAALQEANEALETRVSARTQELEVALRTVMQQEKQLALGRVVMGMAHELNTPLGNARMGASVIHDHATDIHQWLQAGQIRRQALSAAANALSQCSSLVDRSLESAAILVQRLKALSLDSAQEAAQHFDLCQLLRDSVAYEQQRLNQRHISCELEMPEALNMQGAMQALSDVLKELLDNAIEHGLKNAMPAQLRLCVTQQQGSRVRIGIQDNGCGIAADALPRIFDPFYCGQMGRDGAGLGLSMVRMLVEELLQGQIRVSSTPGLGTLAELDLPMQPAASATK